MYPIIKINRSEIIGVPAIHNRAVFAREVNYLCSARETRPEAIAVELGPHIVAELVAWMKEDILIPLFLVNVFMRVQDSGLSRQQIPLI